MQRTRDLRVENFRPLVPPAILLEELPLGEQGSGTVTRGRDEVSAALRGTDDRLVVVVGPAPFTIRSPASNTGAGSSPWPTTSPAICAS